MTMIQSKINKVPFISQRMRENCTCNELEVHTICIICAQAYLKDGFLPWSAPFPRGTSFWTVINEKLVKVLVMETRKNISNEKNFYTVSIVESPLDNKILNTFHIVNSENACPTVNDAIKLGFKILSKDIQTAQQILTEVTERLTNQLNIAIHKMNVFKIAVKEKNLI